MTGTNGGDGPNDYAITEAMIVFGGGFVSGLGRLFRAADADNRATLKAAFPEYWIEYRAIAARTPRPPQ